MEKKKLGFGFMRLPLIDTNDSSSIDQELTNKMVDEFIKKGFNYFDTAYVYHNGMSENAFRNAVVNRYPRDVYTITDKMPIWLISETTDFQKYFNEQLERCGVEYFDYYWLHALRKESYEKIEKFGGFDFLKKMKAEGRVSHIGFSFHDNAEVLDRIMSDHSEIDYVQLQINYFDWNSTIVESRKCHEVAKKHGKPIIVMEPVKGGILANVLPDVEKLFKEYHPDMSIASWAIRYAASLDNVMLVLSGMSNLEQMKDNLSFMYDFQPLDKTEKEIIDKTLSVMSDVAIQCTSCRYCAEECPKNIAIPECFSIYNQIKQFEKTRYKNKVKFTELIKTHGKPSDCINCKNCEERCPQKINISDWMKIIADEIE